MSSDRFSVIHAPLFEPPRPKAAAELTERVAPAQPRESNAQLPVAPRNFVDEHIFGKMARDGVTPAPLASDGEFLRRVSLDLTGRIPASDEIRAFLADTDPQKRDKLIDRLIASEAFVDKWAYF